MTDPTWQTEEEEYDPRSWWQRWRVPLIIGGVVGLFLLLALPSVLARDQIDGLEDDVSDLQTDLGEVRGQADANKAALDEANRILVQLGQEPIPVPDVNVEQNDPDPDDPERQDAETQDPEVDDPDPFDDPETQDSEFDDPELQGEEIQDPEIQEEEIQDPEIPNDCPPGFHFESLEVVVPPEPGVTIPGHQETATIEVCVEDAPEEN